MAEIQNFSKLSKTTQLLISSTIGHLDVWPDGDGTPDFDISVGGIKIDPTEFFCIIANIMDEDVEHRSEEEALSRFDDFLGALTDEVKEYSVNIKKFARKASRRVEEDR